jgi:hypothetical protein
MRHRIVEFLVLFSPTIAVAVILILVMLTHGV